MYEDEDQVHLITDFVSGHELYTRVLMRKRFSEESASLLMLNLLSALDYLHARSIAHRDIKLENVLMVDEQEDSRILLADFGLCS